LETISWLESVLPNNLCNLQRRQHKVNDAKDAVLFYQHFCLNFTAYFRLQLLCRVPYFGAFFAKAAYNKNIKNYLRKSSSAFVPTM